MNSLRTEVQTLVLWWIPAAVMTVLATGLFAIYAQSLPEKVVNSEMELGSFMGQITMIDWAIRAVIRNLDNLVIAIWQYRVATHPTAKSSFIWFLFGLFSGLFSVITYLCIRVYETHEQKADV